MFLRKLPFLGKKNAFYPKTKVVPKTLSYFKTDVKIIFLKNIFLGGGLGFLNKVILGFFANFETPQAPPKIIFLKKNMFSCVLQQLRVFETTFVFG